MDYNTRLFLLYIAAGASISYGIGMILILIKMFAHPEMYSKVW